MNRLRRLLFDSCHCSDDAIIPSVPRRNLTVAVDFAADDLSLARETPAYLWRKEEKWHVVSYEDAGAASPRCKIDSRCSDDGILFPPKVAARRKSKVCSRGWFSSDEEEEALLMSSSSKPKGVAFEAAGKALKESTAVVKRSENPRRDFRRSMVEMVVEKGMYDADELEELLRCFLSLNSRHHHVAIVAAFADVWEAMFSENSGSWR